MDAEISTKCEVSPTTPPLGGGGGGRGEDTPLVSVIVPAYNVASWLPQCLESIAAQKNVRLEVIVVDDGSTDATGDIARRMAERDNRFNVISKFNGGLSSARNAALDVAAGQWLMMVDGDDLLPPHAVSDLLSVATTTRADIVAGRWLLFDDGDEPQFTQPSAPAVTRLTADEAIDAILYQDGRITGSACARLLRRQLFDTLRFPEGKLYEDLAIVYPLYSRAVAGVALSSAVVYGYRQKRSGSILNDFTPRRADVLNNLETLLREFDSIGDATHRPAVNARRLAAALNLLVLMPGGSEYSAMADRCMATIKEVRGGCITDSRVRLKDRLAALASYGGKGLLRALGYIRRR